MTLIELLVVIVILTTVVAAAIPLMSPANDDRRLREASRGLNTYITGAQNRAIALKRPFGIALKRLSQDTGNAEDNGVCLEVFYVEQPAPYSGFDANSRARLAFYSPNNASWYGGLRPLVLVQFVTRGSANPMASDGLPVGWDRDLFPSGLVRPGDIVEINGTQYRLLSDTSDGQVTARLDAQGYFQSNTGAGGGDKATQIAALPLNDTGQLVHVTHDDEGFEIGTPEADRPPFFTYPAPYKILRQAAPTSDEPYQLPEGTAIDLRASGIGSDFFFHYPYAETADGEDEINNSDGIIVLFTPAGRIDRVSYSLAPLMTNDAAAFDQPVADNLFLLVGKRENVPVPDPDDDPTLDPTSLSSISGPNREQKLAELREPINWLNLTARWVVVGSQSGRVVTVENAFVSLPGFQTLNDNETEKMRTDQILAAREFAREMRNMGGR